MTLRRALENSKNLATAHLLDGGIARRAAGKPGQDLRGSPRKRSSIRNASATIRSSSARSRCDRSTWRCSTPRSSTRASARRRTSSTRSIKDGQTVYRAKQKPPRWPVDRAAAFQLRTLLQGVVARGTAARLATCRATSAARPAPRDEFNDGWFVGFSNDVTIAVWVGYDNAGASARSASGQAGGKVAVPIFERIMQAVWTHYAPRTPLSGRRAKRPRHLVAMPIDGQSGERVDSRGNGAFMEYFRLGPDGRYTETVYQLTSRGSEYDIGEGSAPFGLPWFFGGQRDYDGSSMFRGGFPPTSRGNWRPPEDDLRYMPQMRAPQEGDQSQPGISRSRLSAAASLSAAAPACAATGSAAARQPPAAARRTPGRAGLFLGPPPRLLIQIDRVILSRAA